MFRSIYILSHSTEYVGSFSKLSVGLLAQHNSNKKNVTGQWSEIIIAWYLWLLIWTNSPQCTRKYSIRVYTLCTNEWYEYSLTKLCYGKHVHVFSTLETANSGPLQFEKLSITWSNTKSKYPPIINFVFEVSVI